MDTLNELSRTLDQIIGVGSAASEAMRKAEIELDRRKALTDQLEYLLHRMVLAHEKCEGDSEGHWPQPDHGCIECTLGTVPNDKNTGLCAYHETRRVLGIQA